MQAGREGEGGARAQCAVKSIWSRSGSEAVERACLRAGIIYVRGSACIQRMHGCYVWAVCGNGRLTDPIFALSVAAMV